MKVLLINYMHLNKRVGGCETMYDYLHKTFPNSELISTSQFKGDTLKEVSEEIDKYILERNKKEDIFVIKEAELGGVLDTSEVPQINIYQNPFLQIMETFGIAYDSWTFEKKKMSGKKTTVSNYMLNELGDKSIEVIPNCVDTEVFKPMDKELLREKYDLDIDERRVGVWVGAPGLVKNFQRILDLMEGHKDIFWILISKADFNTPYDNSKVFSKVDSKTVSELLNCADFFILTSPIESCGIASFEAMACGVPCILSQAGYFYDYFDDRIGIQIDDTGSFQEHKEAIERINKIKTNPREVIFERGLDLKSWQKRWREIVNV